MRSEQAWQAQCEVWLRADTLRWQALQAAASLGLADWALAAGFVRNLVWDKLHGYRETTPLADIDLIYFDPARCDPQHEQQLETALGERLPLPWSVRNQARMHLRNHDRPYTGLADSMQHWVAEEDAVAVRLDTDGTLHWIAPFTLQRLAELCVTLNRQRCKPDDFVRRLNEKQWLQHWPRLRIRDERNMKCLGLCGSLRAISYNRALLHAMQQLAPNGCSLDVYEGLGTLPLFNPDLKAADPAPVAALHRAVIAADLVIIASPEYAHGVSGVMKNALDWLVGSEAFVHKPVAVLNASPRAHHAYDALCETLDVMSVLRCQSTDLSLPILGSGLDAAGIAALPELATRIAAIWASVQLETRQWQAQLQEA